MSDLENKKILIIGGTSGFGKQTAKLVLEQKGAVLIIGRDEARLKKSIDDLKEISDQVDGIAFDVRDTERLKDYLANIGTVDHVISMVGGAMGGGFIGAPFDEIRETIEEKFFTNLKIVKIIWRHINEKGSIIFTGGSGGHPYDASGAIIGNQAIETMVQGIAVELAPNIRVNAVAPTWAPTGLWRDLDDADKQSNEDHMIGQIPLKRVAEQEEVANAYLFLLENDFVTGQTIHVDGGISVN